MLKLIFYLGLTAFGVVGTFVNPLIGAIACIEAYLLNPNALAMDISDIRYQLIVTVAFLASYLLRRPEPLPKAQGEIRVLRYLWIFIAVGFASCFWAVVSTQVGLSEWFELFKTMIVLPFLVWVIRTERDMTMVVAACLLGIFHASFMHTFGVRLGFATAAHGREYGVLPEGQTAVLIIFIPLLLIMAVKGGKWERLAAIVAIPVVLNSVVSTYQRIGLVVIAAEAVALLLFLPRRVMLAVLPIAALAGVLLVYRLTPPDWWQWMSTIQQPTEESSANSRFVINDASRRMFRDYPMGVGYRNYPDVSPRYLDAKWLTEGKRSAHNMYYNLLCELGIPGLVTFLLAFGGAAWQLRRIRKRGDPRHPGRIEVYAMGFEIGLYGWFIAGWFHDMHNVDPAWWLAAFSVALARLQAKRDEEEDAGESAGELMESEQPA